MKSFISQGLHQGSPRVAKLKGKFGEHFTLFKKSSEPPKTLLHSLRVALGWDLQQKLSRRVPAFGK